MAIVAHVSVVALGPLIFMIILLMLGFVKHIPGKSRKTPYFLFPFDSIISDCKRYDLSVFKAQNKKSLLKCHKNKRKNCFKIFNYHIKYLKKMTTISFSLRVNKQLCGDVDSCKFECNAILQYTKN